MSLAECHPVVAAMRTTEPTLQQEPVTMAEARRQCSIAEGIDTHDSLLQILVAAARQQVEADTGLVCYTGAFTLKMTDWPADDWFSIDDVRPVTAITSITYLDGSGATQTLSTDVYAFEVSGVKQFVRLKYGQTWPATRGDINGITVTFAAGYATVPAVPARVKQACLLLIAHWFENRSAVGSVGNEIALSYQSLVNSLSRRTYP